MTKLLPWLCTLYGFPVRVNQSLSVKMYSFLIVTAYSMPYIYHRFIRNLISPQSSTLAFDRISLLSKINGVEMIFVIFANYFHQFDLIFRPKTYQYLFQHGQVFNFESTTDKFVIVFSFSDFVLMFFIGESPENLIRFISYSMLIFLSHLKVFQYCCILSYNAKRISLLIQLIQSQDKVISGYLLQYQQIVNHIHKSNCEFGVQILIAFSSLVVDILYITGFILVLKSQNKITFMFFLYLFHHLVVRTVMIMYLSDHVTRTKLLVSENLEKR